MICKDVIERRLTCVACRLPFFLVVTAFVAAMGCSKDSDRASVSGKVTFDGLPVASGQIAFEPLGSGRLGIAQIVDGAYAMPAAQGPTPGEYVVRITANRPTGAKPAGVKTAGIRGSDAQGDVYEQYIPANFNDRSELKAQIGDEAIVVRDFELTSS